MKKIPFDYIESVIMLLLSTDALRATKYINSKLIIRAVRRTYRKKISKGNIEITLTVGLPNYLEREFIKVCQKAKERFPIQKVQLKLYNPKPKKLSRK